MTPTRRPAQKVQPNPKVTGPIAAGDLRSSTSEDIRAKRTVKFDDAPQERVGGCEAQPTVKFDDAPQGSAGVSAQPTVKFDEAQPTDAADFGAKQTVKFDDFDLGGASDSPEVDASFGEQEEGETPASSRRARASRGSRSAAPKSRAFLAAKIVIGIALALVVAVLGSFAIYRWVLTDDAADLQGVWYVDVATRDVDGLLSSADEPTTGATIEITSTEIVLTEDVAYSYQLDSFAKTMDLSFFELKGDVRYLFSLDREQVVLVDGKAEAWDTFWFDFRWTAKALFALWFGTESDLLIDENVTLLWRNPIEQMHEPEAADPAAQDPEVSKPADPAAQGEPTDPAASTDPAAQGAGASGQAAEGQQDPAAEAPEPAEEPQEEKPSSSSEGKGSASSSTSFIDAGSISDRA